MTNRNAAGTRHGVDEAAAREPEAALLTPESATAATAEPAPQPQSDRCEERLGEGPILVGDKEQGEPPTLTLPSEPRTLLLGGLLFLATMVTFYVAREIILPVLLAVVLKLLLQPLLRPFERIHIPRAIASLLVVFAVAGGIGGFVIVISAPAISWVEKIPAGLPRLEKHMRVLTEPITQTKRVLEKAESVAQGPDDGAPSVTVKGVGLAGTLFAATAQAVIGILTTILLLFFLLASGDTFLRRIVELLPRFKDKRQAVDIVQHVEHDISFYLVTISAINLAVGVATGVALWLCGIGDPVLWGAVAFLLNYVPILGPLVGVGIFAMVGLLTFDSLGAALLPAGLYLGIHLIEGELITPMLLARRLTLNPVLIILSLVFWYWMWGVPGAILAVPILAIVKIICDRIRPLAPIGHFIEG